MSRFINTIAVLLTFFLLGLSSMSADAASTMKITVYGDGESCPSDCDAHVVFDSTLNGTDFAHAPGDTNNSKCQLNSLCEICFEEKAKQCISVVYRGGGPHKDRFDFTQAFFNERCDNRDNPIALQAQCAEIKKSVKALEGRTNCIKNQHMKECEKIMASAQEKKLKDAPIYAECKSMTEEIFNKGKEKKYKRKYNCAYEFSATGGTRKKPWSKLLAGACSGETYVGRNGLDCCKGNPAIDGPLGLECKGFYPNSPTKLTNRNLNSAHAPASN